ncbi:MAG TPA: hypothetical protein VJ281_09315 [Chthoniobacterales bacterium]|nr:hypothetical protein [Chthoniobacterales bacterium]
MEKPPSSTQQHLAAFVLAAGLISFSLSDTSWAVSPIQISNADALRIGKRVWQNESNGSVAGLTAWNAGEDFASLGIGHFIWYPQGMRGPFEESFPKFLAYAQERNVTVPVWLNQATACPWNSRAEFSRAQNSPQMRELRQFLAHTVDLQAQFLVSRLQQSLAKMLDEAAPGVRANVERQFARVASMPHGCYALVDYVNFKGEGILHTERYQGEGWGLLQVLEQMHGTETGSAAAREFSNSAAAILRRRVQNSPPERHEARWLPGWLNRVHTYSGSS